MKSIVSIAEVISGSKIVKMITRQGQETYRRHCSGCLLMQSNVSIPMNGLRRMGMMMPATEARCMISVSRRRFRQ